MVRPFSAIHSGEHREVGAAFGTVLLVMAAHGLLETARDTMFLSNLPATRLPWMYLAIVVLAVLGGPVLGRAGSDAANRRTLIVMQLAAGLGTALFLTLTKVDHHAVYYALYIWGGIGAALILVRFWLILAERFAAGEAKRLFPIIAAGAVVGSLTGYGIAGLVAWWHRPRALLAGSAVLFFASAAASLVWWRVSRSAADNHAGTDAVAAPVEAGGADDWRSLRPLVGHPYVRRIALLLLLASVAVTLCDFVFKATAAGSIPHHRLASFLATVYFACDLVSAALLLLAIGPLVSRIGVPRALAIRPALLLAGGILFTAAGGLPAALVLRGVDGALRWSLHKTATELLYVPMSPRLRSRVKEASDLVTQRGGQALGSLAILGWIALSGSEAWMGALIVAAAGAWLASAWALREPYVASFREALSGAVIETQLEFPEIDLTSLEALIAALNSPDDHRVIAALDLLGATGRVHLIPALILYHPSREVVLRALELFAAARRRDLLPFGARLLGHADMAVRAAAVRACTAVHPEPDRIRQAASMSCPAISATALIAGAAHGWIDADSALAQVRDRLHAATADADPARFVARAVREFPFPAGAALLPELAAAPDVVTRCEAIRAIGALRDRVHLPILIGALAERPLREAARLALLAYGDVGLAALEEALQDLALPHAVRVHVPRSISRFGHQRAADLLLRRLLTEPGGMVRYKILRGLGRLIADAPGLRLDPAVLEQIVDDHLAKIFPLVHWRAVLEAGAAEQPDRGTPGHHLLVDLLAQKESFAIERLFRALGLKDREAGYAQIYDGLQCPDAAIRASSRELLPHVLPSRWREAIIGLTDDVAIGERLAAGHAIYAPPPLEYGQLVAELIDHPSDVVAAIASYHAVEIGLTGLAPRPQAPQFERVGGLAALRLRSLERLRVAAAGAGGLRNAS